MSNPTDPAEAPARLLLTEPEAAKMLAVSPRTLFDLRARGMLRAVKIGRAVRYDVADLKAFIESQKESVDVAEPVHA